MLLGKGVPVTTDRLEEEAERERAWLSVVVPEELKMWVRVRAATVSKSTSAYIRDLLERDRADIGEEVA
jgi:hypothetical protein